MVDRIMKMARPKEAAAAAAAFLSSAEWPSLLLLGGFLTMTNVHEHHWISLPATITVNRPRQLSWPTCYIQHPPTTKLSMHWREDHFSFSITERHNPSQTSLLQLQNGEMLDSLTYSFIFVIVSANLTVHMFIILVSDNTAQSWQNISIEFFFAFLLVVML